ncbi:MAG: hypothetical protein AAFQ87_09570, partial [Bacteroidota bacterium]
IGIRREDLSKTGEQRVALTPKEVRQLTQNGHRVIIQAAVHPEKGERKRAFEDQAYLEAGAEIKEDLAEANPIFGLKEVEIQNVLPKKAYLIFSHTHKGQIKNRKMLAHFVEHQNTIIDYELVTEAHGPRIITAFTYFAGYAGMIDSLWTLGKRFAQRGIEHPFAMIPQSIEKANLDLIKQILRSCGERIASEGTPTELPPLITIFLGNGKTSTGAQSIYDLLPVEEIRLDQLAQTFAEGDRHKVYKLVLDVPQMYRRKDGVEMDDKAFFDRYLQAPEEFESDMEKVFPYATMWMNCIIWGPEFPRLLTRDQAEEWYAQHQSLEVIGDITCDPEGAIHFSKETWIDDPVFVYDPATGEQKMGFEGEGIAVMAVTNLPCEFAADASAQFSADMGDLISGIATADFSATDPKAAGLPAAIQRAVILWQGAFSPDFAYMKEYLGEGEA